MNFFDYVNEINYGKNDIMVDTVSEKAYNAFMINRALGQNKDTVYFANTMNQYYKLPVRMQFDFLINIVRKGKRFGKFAKADKQSEAFEVVKEYYGYSNEKARQSLKLLSPEQIEILKEKVYKGGRK